MLIPTSRSTMYGLDWDTLHTAYIAQLSICRCWAPRKFHNVQAVQSHRTFTCQKVSMDGAVTHLEGGAPFLLRSLPREGMARAKARDQHTMHNAQKTHDGELSASCARSGAGWVVPITSLCFWEGRIGAWKPIRGCTACMMHGAGRTRSATGQGAR